MSALQILVVSPLRLACGLALCRQLVVHGLDGVACSTPCRLVLHVEHRLLAAAHAASEHEGVVVISRVENEDALVVSFLAAEPVLAQVGQIERQDLTLEVRGEDGQLDGAAPCVRVQDVILIERVRGAEEGRVVFGGVGGHEIRGQFVHGNGMA